MYYVFDCTRGLGNTLERVPSKALAKLAAWVLTMATGRQHHYVPFIDHAMWEVTYGPEGDVRVCTQACFSHAIASRGNSAPEYGPHDPIKDSF